MPLGPSLSQRTWSMLTGDDSSSHLLAQTLAGSRALTTGKPGALGLHLSTLRVQKRGQLRPGPEPQEGVRWTCGQRKGLFPIIRKGFPEEGTWQTNLFM